MKQNRRPGGAPSLPKAPTGIIGLDETTGGRMPAGRPNHAILRAELRLLSPWLEDRGSIGAVALFS